MSCSGSAESRFLAHYQILEEVGRGGMGTVYRALDTLLDREVAVKVLSSELVGADLQDRFVREAKIVARLSHPNIPHIHFIGRAGGRLFFAMEWIEGETLEARLKREPLAVEAALDIAHQVASGLAFAHRAGVVHRDIKPSNVMLTQEGVAKILDFGIARSLGFDSTATVTGQFIGTPHYASPEQARGEKLDARSDIYSLGATLYEMIAGRPPFAGDNPLAVLTSRLLEPPPEIPAEIVCEPPVQQVVRRMMATHPADRFQDCGALARAIDEVYPGPVVPARFAPRAYAAALDLLVAGLPLVLAFSIFFLITKYFPTTLLYDSIAGRLALGAGLLAWLLAYFAYAPARWRGTIGQRLERLRVVARDGKDASRALLLRRNLLLWGPICLALVLQPDMPPVLRDAARADTIDYFRQNLPFAFSLLWLLALVLVPVPDARRRHLADRLAGTEVVETQRRAAASPASEAPRGFRGWLQRAFGGRRALLHAAFLVAWGSVLIFIGLQFQGMPSGHAKGKIFETVARGKPGWQRLWKQLQAEWLGSGETVSDPGVFVFQRGLFVPIPHLDIVKGIRIDNRIYGTRTSWGGSGITVTSGNISSGEMSFSNESLVADTKSEAMEWQSRRREAYLGSTQHFFRALMHQRLAQEGFLVLDPVAFHGLFRVNESRLLLVVQPRLRLRFRGRDSIQWISLPRGFLWIRNSGLYEGEWELCDDWGSLNEVPASALQAYADEQDLAWGRSTASIDKVLELR